MSERNSVDDEDWVAEKVSGVFVWHRFDGAERPDRIFGVLIETRCVRLICGANIGRGPLEAWERAEHVLCPVCRERPRDASPISDDG